MEKVEKIALKDIDIREQKQIRAAEESIAKGNPSFAVETLLAIVNRNPGCIEIRKMLRKASKILYKTKPEGIFGKLMSSVSLTTKSAIAKTKPIEAMEHAERVLAKNPYDITANKLLATAAEAVEFWDIVALALEEIVAAEPKASNFDKLIDAYIQCQNVDQAIKIADMALKKYPASAELQERARQASIAQTMQQGHWEDSGDVRSKLKDENEALDLEKKSRTVNDAETAMAAIPGLWEAVQAEPENLQNYKELSRYYRIINDLDNATLAIQKARETTAGRADATLEKLEHSLTIENFENRIKQANDAIKQAPDNKEYKDYLDSLLKAEHDYKLKATKTLVEKYPNDYTYRYELGILMLESGDLDGSIQQFQLAQRAPKNRHLAMLYLGRAFIQGGKFDLAVDQLLLAKKEINTFNDLKKEIVYELASAYEKAGKQKEAISEYKALYMIDSSYKDVSKKINEIYSE